MVQIISPEEVLKLNRELNETQQAGLRILSPDEVAEVKSGMSPLDLSPSSRNPTSTIGAYLKAVPATAVDITLGAGEGFASAIGEFTGDYDLARSIGAFRDDVNDAIMGDTPDDLQSDFAYKLASGLGSTLPYLGAAIITKNPSLIGRVAAGSFFLSSAGQQVRDDYLASQGVTSEDATDEQMSESNKAGAIGAIPIALAERLGAGLILKTFARGAIPAGQVMERITQYASAGLGEALTEATQSGLINAIASYVRKYDPDRPITAGMAESALIGFLVGGGVNATVDTVNRKITQADRLKAGVQDGSINPKDVIDPDIGSKLTEVAMENDAIPEADTDQQKRITDPTEWRNFVSKTLTPLSRRLGRAGKEIVREFRRYEMDTGIRTRELRNRILEFQDGIKKLKKTSPEDYRALSLALANASELAAPLPQSAKRKLEKKSQLQPSVTLSKSEQLLNEINPEAQQINTQIEQAREALAQRGMKTRIEIVEEGSSFYDPTSNVIAISAREADGTTVAHEFFHAVLGQAVKTDAELQSMTRNMFDSVIRASVDGSSLNKQLKNFVSQYDKNIQNEEFLAQTVGELARQYQTLDLNTKTRIKIWINQAMQALGIDGIFKQAETDAEVIEQLNAFARFAGDPEGIPNDATDFGIGGSRFSRQKRFQDSRAGSRLFNDPLSDAMRISEDYSKKFKISFSEPKKIRKVNKDRALRIAEAYDALESNPKDPEVRKAYNALIKETIQQYNQIVSSGYELILDSENTYSNSQEMINDLRDNKSMLVYPTEAGFGSGTTPSVEKNPLLKKTKYKDKNGKTLLVNDIFRFVHDFFGHSKLGNGFGAIGEENAWNVHSRMYSPLARRAMTTETRGQNSWVNFSGVNESANEKIKQARLLRSNGKTNEADLLLGEAMSEFKFADQKIALLPIEFSKTDEELSQDAKAIEDSTNIEEMRTIKNTSPKEIIDGLNRASESIRREQKSRTGNIGEKEILDTINLITSPRVKGSDRFKKWFGRGQLVHEDGTPMVFFHGTKSENIEAFDPKFTAGLIGKHGWLFFSSDPDLSIEMAAQKVGPSQRYPFRKTVLDEFKENFFKDMNKADEALLNYAKKYEETLRSDALDNNESTEEADDLARAIETKNVDIIQEFFGIDYNDVIDQEINKKFGISQQTLGLYEDVNVIPVYLNAKNVFNPTNESMVDELVTHMREKYPDEIKQSMRLGYEIDNKKLLMSGKWRNYENGTAAKSLRELGYDGILMRERNELSTIAVWNPTLDESKYRTTPYVKSVYNKGTWRLDKNQIKEQKGRRNNTASDKERIQGISDEGLRIMQKYGLTNSYREVRNVLEELKSEYEALGLDMNYIDNYFPRLMRDLEGFKKSIGQTVGIDEEIRRYENMTGQKLTTLERQKMYEKLARSRLYRSGQSEPNNLKERRVKALKESQLQYYADPESALDEYVSRMVQTIETKKLIGDAQSGKTQGKEQVAGRLGEVMERMASQGRLRQDQIEVIQGAVSARFGQHGRQYGFVKGVKNAGYLATMGNIGSAITQIGDFYFTAVQNGVIPTMQALVGSKALTIEDLGIAKDMVTVETKDGQGFLGKSVDTVFKLTGLTAMDRLAKNTNINATYRSLQKGAKANPNSNKYKKTVNRLKRIQGNDAFKTISDLKNGVKSDLVVEAIYNELSDIAPISLTEMPEAYASYPNLRILYSLKSYTIKQLNFVREKAFNKMMSGVASGNPKEFAEGSVNMMKILVFGAVANGSADVLKAILFNREIDEEDFWWNHILRLFGVTKYTTVTARKEGVGTAITKTILPPQAGILNDIFKDIGKATSEEGLKINEMRSMKYVPVVGKIYYWREGKGVDVEEKLSRLRERD